MALLIESDGAMNSNSAKRADPDVVIGFAIGNARRAVQVLRERNVEGYIVFEGDPRHYAFTPDEDFAYPVVIASASAARRWRRGSVYQDRGGIVVVVDGEVQGWIDELRNPEHWQTGAIAVAEDGKTWTAIAGGAQDGSLMWLANDLIPN